MKNQLLLAVVLIFTSTQLKAQNTENGELGINREHMHKPGTGEKRNGSDIVSVDLYTGIGSVTIPIYDYTVDGLNLGITLSNNLKGIQVDQIATEVGLGWTLNAGASITRQVNGLEDEIEIDPMDNPPSGNGYIQYRGAMSSHISQNPNVYGENELDIYSVSLPNKSFELAWDYYSTSGYMTYPKNEVSFRTIAHYTLANYTNDSGSMSFPPHILSLDQEGLDEQLNLYVIDESGNQYYFIRGEYRKKEFKIINTDSQDRWVTEKWVIDKIITHQGAEIKYNYIIDDIDYVQYVEETVTEKFKLNGMSNPSNPEVTIKQIPWTGYKLYLDKIEYPDGTKAIFHHAKDATTRCDLPDTYVLDSISIYKKLDNNYNNTITYRLNYSYFHTPTAANSANEVAHRTSCSSIEPSTNPIAQLWARSTRLKLNSIDRVGTDKTNVESYYKFEYHNAPLPLRLSHQKDYYGYANNASTTPLTVNSVDIYLGIPLHSYNNGYNLNTTYGTSKEPDNSSNLDYIQAGMLTKIINGQGGLYELEYDKPPNITNPACANGVPGNYYELSPTNSKKYHSGGCTVTIDPDIEARNATDGLVVTSIFKHDGYNNDNDIVAEYDYQAGQRFFSSNYLWYLTKQRDSSMAERVYTNSFVNPVKYVRGANHGYSQVTVTENNILNEQLSKNRYEFSNLIMPTNLTDMYDTSFLNGPVVTSDSTKFLHWGGNDVFIGAQSTLNLSTGKQFHTLPYATFEPYLLGALLKKISYDKNNDITKKVENKYELNIYADDSLRIPRDRPVRMFYWDMVDANYNKVGYNWVSVATSHFSVSGCKLRLKRAINTEYIGYYSMKSELIYNYDLKDNLTSVSWQDSKGDHYRKEYIYSFDYPQDTTSLLSSMQHLLGNRIVKYFPPYTNLDVVINHNMKTIAELANEPAYNSLLSQSYGGVWFQRTYYPYNQRYDLPKVRFDNYYLSSITAPVSLASAISDENSAYNSSTGLSSLNQSTSFTLYDTKNNVLEVKNNELDYYKTSIWDSRIGKQVAMVDNARHGEVAYTSFEGLTSAPDNIYDMGNWSFEPNLVVFGPSQSIQNSSAHKPPTGKYLYILKAYGIGNQNITTTLPDLPFGTSKKYIVSFWANLSNGPFPSDALRVSCNSQPVTMNKLISNINGWSLYVGEFNASTYNNNIIIQSIGYGPNAPYPPPGNEDIYIDEVRLYPSDANMTSYTYEPLLGPSSATDDRNIITYFEYDGQGRESVVRDMYGNIKTQKEIANQQYDNK